MLLKSQSFSVKIDDSYISKILLYQDNYESEP